MPRRRCSNCNHKIDRDRSRLDYITVCRACAEAGIVDRAAVVIHGQHKGPDLVSLPHQINDRSAYDRG